MNPYTHSVLDTIRRSHSFWPDSEYYKTIATLKSLIGRDIYLVEAIITDINAAIHHTGKSYRLLAVFDYPQPDPESGLLPHNILIDDGRGINLGRIVRISTGFGFSPPEHNIVYRNDYLINDFFPRYWKRLNRQSVALTSKTMLADILGKTRPQQEYCRIDTTAKNTRSD